MLGIEKYLEYYKKYREGLLYLIFGFFTVVVHLVCYKILLDLGVHYIASTNIAFVAAVLFAYFTNKHIVFKKGNNVLREIVLFAGARLFTQVINNIGLVFAVNTMHMDAFLSQVVLSVVVIVLNYVFSKYAIFIHK